MKKKEKKKRNRKTNFIFWNFKKQKTKGDNRGKTKKYLGQT
jgi:hypothetical protein